MSAAETRPSRVLVIGLDVGDGRLLRSLADDGELPVLAGLMGRGVWQWLATPAEILHVSAWPSIYTGAPPGEHGVYFTFQSSPGIQGWRMFHGDLYGRATFWHLLSEAGVRCTVFDAPYVHPEEPSRATQIFDWGTWARHWRTSSHPPALLRRLQRACGRYPLGLEALDIGLVHSGEMRRRLVGSVAAKATATTWLMEREAWDLFFVTFGETHAAAHYCSRPAGDAARPEDLVAVYRAIDQAIGEIVEQAGEDTTVHVISGDGVGVNHGGWHLLPDVLRLLGYLVEPAPEEGSESRDVVRRLRDKLPKDLRKQIARKLPGWLRHRLAMRVDTGAIEWSSTRAYCLPTDLEGYIRINLVGREPQGIVEPGEAYDAVCAELTDRLLELTDPATGGRVVRRVVRVDEVFPGSRADQLPDLVVLWEAELGQLQAVSGPGIGTVEGAPLDARPGTHEPPGFLLTVEPGGASGETTDQGHVQDLAPSLLSHFGVATPSYMTSPTNSLVTNREQPS